MPEYRIGKQRTRHDRKKSTVIHITVPRRIHERLEAMRAALQKEIGPDVTISLAAVARRILYQHASLRKLAHRHQPPEPQEELEL